MERVVIQNFNYKLVAMHFYLFPVYLLRYDHVFGAVFQVKLRRHSWYMNLLMSGIPVTVSAGWRRYHTNVIYAMENEKGHHRLLTMTPEHKDLLAVIWGPLALPKTRIVAVHNKLYCTNARNRKV